MFYHFFLQSVLLHAYGVCILFIRYSLRKVHNEAVPQRVLYGRFLVKRLPHFSPPCLDYYSVEVM